MNLKRIIIAITVVLIGTGNINAQDMKTEVPKISDFPVGEENTGYAQYFTGKSWLAPLTTSKELNVPMSNVTFEPGCRNNWAQPHRRTTTDCRRWCGLLSGTRKGCTPPVAR